MKCPATHDYSGKDKYYTSTSVQQSLSQLYFRQHFVQKFELTLMNMCVLNAAAGKQSGSNHVGRVFTRAEDGQL